MSVKHKPLLHETVAAGMRSEVAAIFFSYRRIPLNVTYSISVALHHYEKKLTKNFRPTDILLVFSLCSQIY